jgi:hypothetical protein
VTVRATGPEATATGTAARNVHGRARAITVISTVKWWGGLWLPLFFFYASRVRGPSPLLAQLSFIHFARWTLIRRLPSNGPDRGQRLRHAHLVFESNFNGGQEEYIDAFSHILTRGMTLLWGSSFGFPKPLPTGPFKRYIARHEVDVCHFYSAYPDASTTMVNSALELEGKLATLAVRAPGLDPDAFAGEWRAFLTDVQRCL